MKLTEDEKQKRVRLYFLSNSYSSKKILLPKTGSFKVPMQ